MSHFSTVSAGTTMQQERVMTGVNLNHWDAKMTTAQGFLAHLRDSSRARMFCRQVIRQLIEAKEAQSVLEAGFGGLNEIIALTPVFDANRRVRYSGTDWTL